MRKTILAFMLSALLAAAPLGSAAAADQWGEANELLRAGKPQEASEAFSNLIRQDPNDVRGYMGRGRAFRQMGDLAAAIADFDKAIALDPNNVNGYNYRGISFTSKGEPARAIQDLDRALKLNPGNSIFYYNRALAWDKLNEPDKAVTDYNRTIELNPKDIDAYKNRSRALIKQGFYDKALADCEKAIELNPQDGDAYFCRASVHDAKGEDDQALNYYNKAVELGPTEPAFYNDRGFFYELRGEHDRAIADFTKIIELDPKNARENARAYNNRGYARLSKGDTGEAMMDFDKAIELNPRSAKALRNRALAWLIQGEFEKAIADSTRSIEMSPQEARSFLIRSEALEAREAEGDNKAAKEDFMRAMILGPQPLMGMAAPVTPETIARERAALKAVLEGDTPETRSQLAAVRHEHAFEILSDPRFVTKREYLEEAVAYARSATTLDPESPGHWLLTGLLFRELGKTDDKALAMAEQALLQASEVDPEYAAGSLELGYMMIEEEREWDAMTALESALENDPGHVALAATGPLCAMYALNDQGFRGLAFFREVYAANPEVPALGIGLAIMLDHAGDRKAALRQARDIMFLEEPDSQEYAYAAALVDEWEGKKL